MCVDRVNSLFAEFAGAGILATILKNHIKDLDMMDGLIS